MAWALSANPLIRTTDPSQQEMLEAARLRSGGLEMRKERFDLSELADQLTRRVQAMTDRHRLTIISEGTVEVEADHERIEDVLVNLLHNAIDYSPCHSARLVSKQQHEMLLRCLMQSTPSKDAL